MKIIVTAGGQGTKMWPYSRQDKPKQFQPIIGDYSSYEQTIKILLEKFTPEDIYISTKRKFIKYVSEQSPQIPLRNYIVEPDIAKDRGPADGLVFLRLSIDHPDEPFFIVQADLIREPKEKFLEAIAAAEKLVLQHKRYITGGLKALTPNMDTDYLQLGERVSTGDIESYAINHFHYRRNSLAKTRELIENFRVVAHWNHLCWYPQPMLDAYKKYRPDWYEALMRIRDVLGQQDENQAIERIYAHMEKGPTEEVTKHIMESGDAIALLLPFKLADVGNWGSVYDFFEDGLGNYEDGNIISIATRGSLIKSSNATKLIAVAGGDNLVIVDTPDVLLVTSKEEIGKIKDIQKILEDRGATRYL